MVPPCFDQSSKRLILTGALTGTPVETYRSDLFLDSQATFSVSTTGEDSQPIDLPSLSGYAPTPPDHCQYEFVLFLVYRVCRQMSSPGRIGPGLVGAGLQVRVYINGTTGIGLQTAPLRL